VGFSGDAIAVQFIERKGGDFSIVKFSKEKKFG
jgi:hypothetical protein